MNVCESNARSNIDMRISACPWHVSAACLSIIARQLALQDKMTIVQASEASVMVHIFDSIIESHIES
jgi:hypothetical protein